jgi:4-amino-4-deoxy-L-arabinose transferase-like glycosyltransferase
MTAIAWFVLIFLACVGAGQQICLLLGMKKADLAHRFLFSCAFGLGLLAYATLALGLVGALTSAALTVLIIVMLVAGGAQLARLARELGNRLKAAASARVEPLKSAAAIFLALVGFFTLMGALTPSTSNDWDGLSYHLAAAKIFVSQGGIKPIWWMSHSNFPFTWEMLYTVGLALHGQALAKLFHWLAGVLTAGCIYALAARVFSSRAAILATFCFAAAPVVLWEATTASNDLAGALFTALAILGWLRWRNEGEWGWLAASAVSCGLALGCKMTAGVLWFFLAVSTFVLSGAQKRPQRQSLGFLLISAAVACPWYLKSYVWTGNPVYPFFYNLFGGVYWSPEAAAEYRQEQLSFGLGHSPWALLKLPFNLTFAGDWFSNRPGQPFTVMTQSIGPLFLALIPGLFFARPLPREARWLLGFAVFFAVSWFFLTQHVRYALPVLPVLAVLAGGGAEAAPGLARSAARAVCAFAGFFALCLLLLLVWPGLRAALRLESEDQYLRRNLDYYPTVQMVNSLPPGSKVLLYGETRGFYFHVPYMWGNHHHEIFRYDRMRGPADLVRAYRKHGITHLLMTRPFEAAVQSEDKPLARRLRQAIEAKMVAPVQEVKWAVLWRVGQPELPEVAPRGSGGPPRIRE